MFILYLLVRRLEILFYFILKAYFLHYILDSIPRTLDGLGNDYYVIETVYNLKGLHILWKNELKN